MPTISTEIALVWQLKKHNHYAFTKCGRCFNLRTGKELKQAHNARCIGYYIAGKFQSLSALRRDLEKIPEPEKFPF